MKRFLLAVLTTGLLVTSCKDKSAETKNTDMQPAAAKAEVKGMAAPVDEMSQKIEELKKLTPLGLDELQTMLPTELDGMKRNGFNSSSAMGYSFANGHYQKGKKGLDVMIYDCAGESGSAWYSATYWDKMNFQQESETEYTKAVAFMGGKAIENYKKDTRSSSITYVANGRLLVILTGTNMTPEELKLAAQKLNLKVS